MRLRSGATVAVACSCSWDLTLSLETSICHRCKPKKIKKKKDAGLEFPLWLSR